MRLEGEPAAARRVPVEPRVGERRRPASGTDPRDELYLLRAAVEGGLDGMVVVSADSVIITFNRRFQEIWPIPPEVVAGGSDEAALASVLDKLLDPDAFLARVHELYERASGSSRDELLLLDGRVLDRYGTALHDDDGTYLGWAWYFRDVTAERAAAIDASRLGALVAVAQELGEAHDEDDVLAVVSGLGASVMGATGVLLCLRSPTPGRLRTLATSFFAEDVRRDIAELSESAPLPLSQCALTGTPLFFADREDALAQFPDSAELYERARIRGSAVVPLAAQTGTFGSLGVAFDRPHAWRAADRDLLQALGALTAQTLQRLRAHRAEQQANAAVRQLSETLQRSLLTAPPRSAAFELAVRYQPAAQEAQVGGDWYDAFSVHDSTMTLVVGDVAGHDRNAAAAMAQVRNVLRGVAQTLDAAPGAVLRGLDVALARLDVQALATAVLCEVGPAPACEAPQALLLRWSNAGHPPPLLVHPDGRAELLGTDPDLLLGIQPSATRGDHQMVLPPGATLVLYSDGIVERRDHALDIGLERLRQAASDLHELAPDALCDALLARLAVGAEDDVALLVLRVRS